MASTDSGYYSDLAGRAVHDDAAFEELYRHFFPRVYNFIYSRLKNAADADEVAGITFQKMNDHLAEYDATRSGFSTWLFRIAANAVTDTARRTTRRQEAAWEDFFDPAAPEHEEPEARMLTEERHEALLKAVGKLGEREQKIIALKFWSGLKNREIAEVMDLTPSNVGTILQRSLQVLKRQLQAYQNT
ncbi:MAG: sigma-70 family RNA polymerase sigma factor [Selenomonadaceae bacterium]|nr:sigma-70 family RNA polymerase sigma factor [Selenomonadaceae bacterium]